MKLIYSAQSGFLHLPSIFPKRMISVFHFIRYLFSYHPHVLDLWFHFVALSHALYYVSDSVGSHGSHYRSPCSWRKWSEQLLFTMIAPLFTKSLRFSHNVNFVILYKTQRLQNIFSQYRLYHIFLFLIILNKAKKKT